MKPDLKHLTLAIPEKSDVERNAVAAAWRSFGGNVIMLERFWEPPQLPYGIRVYGDHVFCHVLAQKLGLRLISPADDLLLHVEPQWAKRQLHQTTLDQIRRIAFPCFVKPLVPKMFRARVFDSPFELEEECRQLPPQTGMVCCETVKFSCKTRAFITNGEIVTISLYEGEGNIEDGITFLKSFLRECYSLLPVTCVADIGYIPGRGWALIKFNASWGAGLKGCDPLEVVRCIADASQDVDGQ